MTIIQNASSAGGAQLVLNRGIAVRDLSIDGNGAARLTPLMRVASISLGCRMLPYPTWRFVTAGLMP